MEATLTAGVEHENSGRPKRQLHLVHSRSGQEDRSFAPCRLQMAMNFEQDKGDASAMSIQALISPPLSSPRSQQRPSSRSSLHVHKQYAAASLSTTTVYRRCFGE